MFSELNPFELLGDAFTHVTGAVAGCDHGYVVPSSHAAVLTPITVKCSREICGKLGSFRTIDGILMIIQIVGQLEIVRVDPLPRLDRIEGLSDDLRVLVNVRPLRNFAQRKFVAGRDAVFEANLVAPVHDLDASREILSGHRYIIVGRQQNRLFLQSVASRDDRRIELIRLKYRKCRVFAHSYDLVVERIILQMPDESISRGGLHAGKMRLRGKAQQRKPGARSRCQVQTLLLC